MNHKIDLDLLLFLTIIKAKFVRDTRLILIFDLHKDLEIFLVKK